MKNRHIGVDKAVLKNIPQSYTANDLQLLWTIIEKFSEKDWKVLRTFHGISVTPQKPIFKWSNKIVFRIEDKTTRDDVTIGAFSNFIDKPLENMPLHINDTELWSRTLALWRLKVAK